jgi:hypothetical protein
MTAAENSLCHLLRCCILPFSDWFYVELFPVGTDSIVSRIPTIGADCEEHVTFRGLFVMSDLRATGTPIDQKIERCAAEEYDFGLAMED